MCFAIFQMLTEAFKNWTGQATSLYRSAQGADDGRWVVVYVGSFCLSLDFLFGSGLVGGIRIVGSYEKDIDMRIVSRIT